MKRGWDFDVVPGEGDSCEVKLPNKDPVNVEQVSGMVLEAMKLIVETHFGR